MYIDNTYYVIKTAICIISLNGELTDIKNLRYAAGLQKSFLSKTKNAE